jgi:hypothetical protein
MRNAYDRLQRRKYWRSMDKLELVAGIIIWSIVILGVVLMWRYGLYTTYYSLNY